MQNFFQNAVDQAKSLYGKLKEKVNLKPVVTKYDQIKQSLDQILPSSPLQPIKYPQVLPSSREVYEAIRQKLDQVLPSASSNQPLFQLPGVGFKPQIPSPTIKQAVNTVLPNFEQSTLGNIFKGNFGQVPQALTTDARRFNKVFDFKTPEDVNMTLGGMIGGPGAATWTKKQLNLVKSGILNNPEVKNLVGRFAELAERNPKGINRKSLGSFGDYIQSLGETVFGKKAANLTNSQLKNAFDNILQAADNTNIRPQLSVGLAVDDIRQGQKPLVQGGVKPTAEQISQAESQIFKEAQAAMNASQSSSPYQQTFNKMRNFLRLAGEKRSKETGELFREHIPRSVVGQSSDELASSMGMTENELMSKLTEGLNIGGTGLRKSRGFTNVPSIDNPLMLGKDWRIRKNVEEGKKFVSEMMEEKRIFKDPKGLTDSFDDLVNKAPVDVKKKVNFFDYLRTPNRVLEKIGLGQEAKLLRTKYDDYLSDLPKEIDKITAWSKRVPASSNQRIFQWLDGDKIKLNNEELKVANEVKDYLGQWADKLKLPQDKRVSSYITHLFEKGKITKEFDPDLAKIIQGKVVGSVYDPFLQRRVGAPEYLQDTWRALDAYVKRATRKFHMDQALEKVAAKAEDLPLESFNYVKGRIARINMQPHWVDDLIDNAVKSSPIGYKFGQRPTTAITQKARQAVFRGLLGLNPGTALRNLQQTTNTYATLGEKHFGIGVGKTLLNLPKLIAGKETELEQAGVLGKDFIQDRTINAVGKFWQHLDDTLFYMFNMAEKVNRGIGYWGAKSKALSQGMDEQKAIQYAKDIVGKTQFYYDVIDTPAALQSDLAKTFFQFAKYPLAQSEFLLEMVKRKDVAGSLRWIASNLLFVATAGKLLGLEPQDMFPQFRFGVPPTLQLPFETGKAALNVPDQYGNVSDEQNPLMRVLQSKDVLRGALNYVPAGGQIRRSVEAIDAMNEGASFTPSGKFRFEVKPEIKSLLFGIWSSPEAKAYLDKKEGKVSSDTEKSAQSFRNQEKEIEDSETKLAIKIYGELQKLSPEDRFSALDKMDAEGKLTDTLLSKLSAIQKAKSKTSETRFVKAVRIASQTNFGKAKFINIFLKNKTPQEKYDLLNELEEAGILTDDLLEKISQLAN